MMGLDGPALEVATDIVARFPEVKIISGRRTVASQAMAMAENVIKRRAKDRIRGIPRSAGAEYFDVYVYRGRIVQELHGWANDNPDAAAKELAAAFDRIISAFPADEQRRLSKHFTGEAFDVQSFVGGRAEEVLDALRVWATRRNGRLLTSESGLVVWHWQAE